MWEDILLVGVTPSLKKDKTPCLLMHGWNEEGEKRYINLYVNEEEFETEDEVTEDLFTFSSYLELVLGILNPQLRNYYDEYVNLLRKKAPPQETHAKRWAIKSLIAKAATAFAKVKEGAEQHLSYARLKEMADTVAEQISNLVEGRVIRVDWGVTKKNPNGRDFEGIKNTLLPVIPSKLDGQETFGNREVADYLQEFEDNAPKTYEERLEETLEALEQDEEFLSGMENATDAPEEGDDDAPSEEAPKSSKKTRSKKDKEATHPI